MTEIACPACGVKPDAIILEAANPNGTSVTRYRHSLRTMHLDHIVTTYPGQPPQPGDTITETSMR